MWCRSDRYTTTTTTTIHSHSQAVRAETRGRVFGSTLAPFAPLSVISVIAGTAQQAGKAHHQPLASVFWMPPSLVNTSSLFTTRPGLFLTIMRGCRNREERPQSSMSSKPEKQNYVSKKDRNALKMRKCCVLTGTLCSVTPFPCQHLFSFLTPGGQFFPHCNM